MGTPSIYSGNPEGGENNLKPSADAGSGPSSGKSGVSNPHGVETEPARKRTDPRSLLWEYFVNEHDIILLDSELHDIIGLAQKCTT